MFGSYFHCSPARFFLFPTRSSTLCLVPLRVHWPFSCVSHLIKCVAHDFVSLLLNVLITLKFVSWFHFITFFLLSFSCWQQSWQQQWRKPGGKQWQDSWIPHRSWVSFAQHKLSGLTVETQLTDSAFFYYYSSKIPWQSVQCWLSCG